MAQAQIHAIISWLPENKSTPYFLGKLTLENKILNRNTNYDESEYFIRLEPKLARILSLIQRYIATQEYSEVAKHRREVIEQAKKIEEKNKRLRYVLESIHRLRT